MTPLALASDADIRRLLAARGRADGDGEPDWTLEHADDDGVQYRVDGELHRTDGPALIARRGDLREWWQRGLGTGPTGPR